MLSNLLTFLLSATLFTNALPQILNTGVVNANTLTSAVSANMNALSSTFSKDPWVKTPFVTCTVLSSTDLTQFKYFIMNCKLTATTAPKSDVIIYLSAYGAKFNLCYMKFEAALWTPAWSVYVYVTPDLNLFPSSGPISLTIYAVPSADSIGFANQYNEWTVSITSRAPATCSVWGDLHIKTFDMKSLSESIVDSTMLTAASARTLGTYSAFSYQGLGNYTIVQSSQDLWITGVFTACGVSSCLSQVTVQYQLITYTISTVNGLNGVELKVKTVSINYVLGGSSITSSANLVQIFLDDGSILTMSLNNGAISLVILLAPVHYQRVTGLCNFWNDSIHPLTLVPKFPATNTVNDNTVKTIQAWGDSWSNLLSNQTNDNTDSRKYFVPAVPVPEYCAIPGMVDMNAALLANINAAAKALVTSQTHTKRHITRSVVPAAGQSLAGKSCAIVSSDAQAYCKVAIQAVIGCDSVASLQTFIDACVSDAMASCSYDLVQAHRFAYLQICSSQASALLQNSNPAYAALGYQINAAIGGNGKVASCRAGFSGTACDVDMSKYTKAH